MPRGRGRGLDPERALEISINGTAIRLACDDTPTIDAINELRQIAGTRTDLLAKEAGSMIGGHLGHPLSNPLHLKAAYLLVLAGDGKDHAALVTAADVARENAGGSAYSL